MTPESRAALSIALNEVGRRAIDNDDRRLHQLFLTEAIFTRPSQRTIQVIRESTVTLFASPTMMFSGVSHAN